MKGSRFAARWRDWYINQFLIIFTFLVKSFNSQLTDILSEDETETDIEEDSSEEEVGDKQLDMESDSAESIESDYSNATRYFLSGSFEN